MATKQRRAPRGLVHHSDKGSQYMSHAYGRELATWGMLLTGTGACPANAYIESCFATLIKRTRLPIHLHYP
jgi:putative transposase